MAIFKKWMHRMNGDVAEEITLDAMPVFHVDALLIEQYPDAIYVLDSKLQLIDSNEKMKLMFKDWKPLLEGPQKESFDVIGDYLQRALKGETVHYELEIRDDDQRLRKVSITNTPVYKDHLIQGVYGIVKDLSVQTETQNRFALLKVGRELLEQVPGLMMLEVNLKKDTFTFSQQVSSMLGISRNRLNKMSYQELANVVHEEDRPSLVSTVRTLVSGQKANDFELQIRIWNELERHYFLVTLRGALSLDRQTLTYVMFPAEDQQRIEHALEDRDALMQRICELSDTAICDFSFDTHQLEFATAQFQVIFGYTSKQFNAHPEYWKVVIVPEDLPQLELANRQTRQQNDVEVEYRICIGNQIKWIRERRHHLYRADGTIRGFQALIRDITKQRAQEAEVVRLHAFDPITNIPNRETMFQSIAQLIQAGSPFSLFTISFNRIGDINRTFGYEYGDRWRVQTTHQLQACLPDQALIGHLDGDTSLVVIPGAASDTELFSIGQRATALSKHCFQLEPYQVYPYVQVGVSRYPMDASDAQTLIKRSYMAMGRAGKQGAPDVALYASHMNIDALKRYELLRDMPKAVETDEFYVVYQPKVNAWTGQIVGAEALMRWNHPTWGIVSPLDFIPLAEESNLFIDLTDYLINQVFSFLSTLDHKLPISLNISSKYLYHDRLIETFESASARYQVPLFYIELEVAETSQLEDSQHVLNVFALLRKLGIQLAIDDFGKGYSSLAYLQKFPLNTLKVDRLFGHRVSENKHSRAIIQSLIVLAREFDLGLVVEGIERIDDLLLLRKLGCETIQGYIFSRPLSRDAFYESLQVGKLLPNEEVSHERHLSDRLIHAGVTITTIRHQSVSVGVSPIVITSRAFNRLYFYAALRLPVDGSVHFVLRFQEGEDIPFTLEKMTEVTDGLYQYKASYESNELLEMRLQSLEKEKTGQFDPKRCIQQINSGETFELADSDSVHLVED